MQYARVVQFVTSFGQFIFYECLIILLLVIWRKHMGNPRFSWQDVEIFSTLYTVFTHHRRLDLTWKLTEMWFSEGDYDRKWPRIHTINVFLGFFQTSLPFNLIKACCDHVDLRSRISIPGITHCSLKSHKSTRWILPSHYPNLLSLPWRWVSTTPPLLAMKPMLSINQQVPSNAHAPIYQRIDTPLTHIAIQKPSISLRPASVPKMAINGWRCSMEMIIPQSINCAITSIWWSISMRIPMSSITSHHTLYGTLLLEVCPRCILPLWHSANKIRLKFPKSDPMTLDFRWKHWKYQLIS